jgi:4-amino-4-deoxy-L-arabinose transferase-like glycosyltransferase
MTMHVRATSTPTPIAPSATTRLVWMSVAIFLGVLTAGMVMVFVGFRMQSLVETKVDPYYFGEMGKSVARGDGFASFGVLIQRRAPLYPLMIGGIYWLFGEQSTLVLLAQCLLLAGTCVLVFDIGRRLFNERTGVIAALFCALNPMLLRYVGDLQLETLLTFLFSLTIWFSVRFYARPSVRIGVLLGVSAALASLTKAVVVPYPALFAVAVVAFTIVRRRRGEMTRVPWAPLAAMLAAMAVVIAPWTARNYIATGGHIVLISSGASDAFLRGYVFSKPDYATLRLPPYEFAENESNEWFISLSRSAGAEWQRNDYETDQILNRAALQKLAAEPGEFVRKSATGLLTFWYEMTSLPNSILAGGLAVGAWALASIGLWRAGREGRPAWLLILPVLYLNVFLALLLALGRYSVPILPALLIVSAFGVDTLLSRRAMARA